MTEQVRSHPKVGHAWIAQKAVTELLDYPVYVLVVTPKHFWQNADKVIKDIAESGEMHLPDDTFIVSNRGDTRKIGKKAKKVGTKLF